MPQTIPEQSHYEIFSDLIDRFARGESLEEIDQRLNELGGDDEAILEQPYQPFVRPIANCLKRRGIVLPQNGYTKRILNSEEDIKLEQFLKALLDDNVKEISPFVALLNQSKEEKKYLLRILIGYTLLGILNVFLASHQFLFAVLPKLGQAFESIAHAALRLLEIGGVGLGFNLILSIYSTVNLILDPTLSRLDKTLHAGANILAGMLNSLAYGLMITAAGAVSPVAATLFVCASFVEVFRSTYNYIKSYNDFYALTEPDESSSLQDRVYYAQQKIMLANQARTALMGIAGAIAMTAVVAIWVFCPPSIVLTIGCIVAMIGLQATQYGLNKSNQKKMEESLQQKVSEVLDDASPEELDTLENDGQLPFESPSTEKKPAKVPKPSISSLVRDANLQRNRFFKSATPKLDTDSLELEAKTKIHANPKPT